MTSHARKRNRREPCHASTPIPHEDGLAAALGRATIRSMSPITTRNGACPNGTTGALFEKLILDGFQAGLSWITILRKRDAFRAAFDGFKPEKIARYNAKKVAKLMENPGIVRNRAKIEAATGAGAHLSGSQEQGGFARHLWGFVDGSPIADRCERRCARSRPRPKSRKSSSKDLKARGANFVGPTIVYAFMQAVGMVNDHLADCCRMRSLREARREIAVVKAPRAWQRMLSGRRLDLLDPSPLDIEIADIAHGLARVARWNGQTKGRRFFRSRSIRCWSRRSVAAIGPDAPPLAPRRAAARCARICDRRHDLAVQGGARRRLQGGRAAPAGGDPSPLRPARQAPPALTKR